MSATTKVYEYGVPLPSKPGPELAATLDMLVDTLREANTYRNLLAAVERQRRASTQEMLEELVPALAKKELEVAAAEEEIEEMRDELLLFRQQERARSRLPVLEETIKEKRSALWKLSRERNAIRTKFYAISRQLAVTRTLEKDLADKAAGDKSKELRTKIAKSRKVLQEVEVIIAGYTAKERRLAEKIAERSGEIGKVACAAVNVQYHNASSLHWATKNAAKAAIDAAKSARDVQDKHFDGEGLLSVQLGSGTIKNRTVAHTLEHGNLYVQVEQVPLSEVVTKAKNGAVIRNGKKAKKRYQIRFMIKAAKEAGGKEPVMVCLPFTMHRDMPAHGIIPSVHLRRRRLGSRSQWLVQFVVKDPQGSTVEISKTGGVGVDLGWRVTKEGLRVGYWVSDNKTSVSATAGFEPDLPATRGKHGEIVLPHELLDRWKKCESLQSIMSRLFDESRDTLKEFLGKFDDVPAWLTAKTEHLGKWKSGKRLAGVVYDWRTNRFKGDKKIFETLEAWRKQNRHLWTWYINQMRRARGHRDQFYRKLAADLRKSSAEVFVEDINWQTMMKASLPEDDGEAKLVRYYQKLASVGKLKLALQQCGMTFTKRPAVNTTLTCHKCGHVNDFNTATSVTQTCQDCGVQWDQDYNAAVNLLRGMPKKVTISKRKAS